MGKSKFYGAFVLNRRVVLHAIDATPARWRGGAGSSPLDRARTAPSSLRNDLVKNYRVHPTQWLISTQMQASIGFSVSCISTRKLLTKASTANFEAMYLWKSKFYGAFALNRRVVLHAIDATLAR